MIRDYEIIIIGGGPGGVAAAISAKQHYPAKEVLLIEKEDLLPSSGVEHMVNNFWESRLLDVTQLEDYGVALLLGEVKEINRFEKTILFYDYETKEDSVYQYEKLVLATGSKPIIPEIRGLEKEGVFIIRKQPHLMDLLRESLRNSRNVLIMGGGLIGIEFSAYFAKELNKKVCLVEKGERIAKEGFDPEFSNKIREKLESMGVTVITNNIVKEFLSDGNRVNSVLLADGRRLNCDTALICVGYEAETRLARKAGLELALNNTIRVNEYMMTSDENIFAVGDCAEKKDFFTRKTMNVMLASTATSEGRTAGASLYKPNVVKVHQGTIGTYSSLIDDLTIGTVGYTQERADNEGFEIIIGSVEIPPIPETDIKKPLMIKLIFTAQTEVIIGAQVLGGEEVSELINVLSTAIQKTMTIAELETLQVATHVGITYPPTVYPVIKAAEIAHVNYLSHDKPIN